MCKSFHYYFGGLLYHLLKGSYCSLHLYMWICLILIADLFLLHVLWSNIFKCMNLYIYYFLDEFELFIFMKLYSLFLTLVFILKSTLPSSNINTQLTISVFCLGMSRQYTFNVIFHMVRFKCTILFVSFIFFVLFITIFCILLNWVYFLITFYLFDYQI